MMTNDGVKINESMISEEELESWDMFDIYHCLFCQSACLVVCGMVIHDDVYHPPFLTFNEEDNPQ